MTKIKIWVELEGKKQISTGKLSVTVILMALSLGRVCLCPVLAGWVGMVVEYAGILVDIRLFTTQPLQQDCPGGCNRRANQGANCQ